MFTEPSRFDVGREPNRHLGFGSGVHFCLGAALARMEVDTFSATDSPTNGNRGSRRAQIFADHLRRWSQAPTAAICDVLKDFCPHTVAAQDDADGVRLDGYYGRSQIAGHVRLKTPPRQQLRCRS